MIVISILLGILSLVCAGICFWHPFEVSVVYQYLLAAYIGVMGIFAIVAFFSNKKRGTSSKAAAVTGVSGLVFGIFGVLYLILNLTIPFFAIAQETLLTILFLVFLLIEGVSMIVSAATQATSKAIRVIFGILITLLALAGFGSLPFTVGVFGSVFGILTAIGFAVNGILLIVQACAAGK